MQTLPHDPIKIMSQVAALCSDLNMHEQAIDIFERLAELRDQDPNALVSLALAMSRAGNEGAAMGLLKRVLSVQPSHDMARVLVAIHLHKGADPGGKTMLRSVLADATDTDAIALAVSVQDEILNTPPQAERVARHRYTRVDAD